MPLAVTGEDAVLDALLSGSRFVSLHGALPPGGEVSAGDYLRKPVTFVKTSGPDPTVYKNSNSIEYLPAVNNWGTINYFGIWSSLTGGDLLAYNNVNTPQEVGIDDIVLWGPHSLVVDTN
jgi:hypothetical protein